jgi:hypothetical protein
VVRNVQDETNEGPDNTVFLDVGLVNLTFIPTQIPEDPDFLVRKENFLSS